jgi:polysaccharide biosynthesis transport protein
MQDLLNSESNNEIDLRELFKTLWAYKILIASTCILGIVTGGYYARNTDKKFTSTAIFKLEDKTSKGLSMDSEIGVLASLVGMGVGSTTSPIPLDQIKGRVFIEKLDEKLNFQVDKYFNTYNPNSIDPIWKSIIKRALSWQKYPASDDEAIWQSIVENYLENVILDVTEEGSVTIEVTHKIPQRAAEIANLIMNTIIADAKNRKDTDQDQMLSYLSNTLAKALSDLEISQSNLKEFALENSALPLESFAAGSLELDALREQLSQTSKLYEAVKALSLMLTNKTTDQNNYVALRKKHPIVDQVEFRRILGQNEIISSWSWPSASSAGAVLDTLFDRKSRLQSQINTSQIDAENSSLALETYAKLEREAKIAEATYTVLIEQVKAQSMAAGYSPDIFEVYEYASVPITPSKPKRILVLAIGATLGLFFGLALSLFFALRRGVFYSKESIKSVANAKFTASMRAILPFRNKSLKDVDSMLIKNPYTALRDMAVEIHISDTTQVVVTSQRTKLMGNDVARALGSYMQSDTLKVAVIDFSSKSQKLNIEKKRPSIGSFFVAESFRNVSVLRANDNLAMMELLSRRDFVENIHSVASTVDLLFLCADNNDVISLLRALQGQKAFHLTLARTKYTKSANLTHINSLLPIQGLLHE